MPFLDSKHQRAAILITLLGLGLAIALAPYASGLLGAPVLYVMLAPVHRLLARWLGARIAALLVIVVTVLALVIPGIWLAGRIAGEAQAMTQTLRGAALLDRLQRLEIGGFELGPSLRQAGEAVVTWMGGNALRLVGTATRMMLNMTFAMFGLYYLFLAPGKAWSGIEPYVPFSAANTEILLRRFRDVTTSTVIGTGVTALLQGLLLGIGFAVVGIDNALFWGVVTAVFAILPLVGSGIVWGPAVLSLLLAGRHGAAIGLGLWSLVVVANVDNVIRPMVYNRYARIHPVVTLVGAVAGVSYLGLIGLLIGPLALSYFFEITRMYQQEYFITTGTFPVPDHVPGASRPGVSAPGSESGSREL